MSVTVEKRRAQMREACRRWRARHPERARAAVANWKRRYPERHAAHMEVLRAVERGDLVRPPACERPDCSEPHPHAHHDDYDKPLEVRWLCPVHHREADDALAAVAR